MEKKKIVVKKTPQKKPAEPAPAKKVVHHKERYHFAVGRRKTATASVKLFVDGAGEITVNERPFQQYFPTLSLQKMALDPLVALGLEKKVKVLVNTSGGGVSGQAKAMSL